VTRPGRGGSTRAWAIATTAALAAWACARGGSGDLDGAPRIVCVGGAVCETVFALGDGDRVVAVDSSTVYPPAAARLPKVGYQRTLSAEPILALDPAVVIAAAEAGPAVALDQLRAAGVRVAVMPEATTPATAAARVRSIAAALGRAAAGARLAAEVEADADAAVARARRPGRAPRALFVYARGAGTAMVSGAGTVADAMLRLAGAVNAVDGHDGFQPLSAEALVAAAPEVILVPARGLDSLGGVDGLLALPGVAATPAGRARRVVAMDDLLLLGFGPRLGAAIDELARKLGAS